MVATLTQFSLLKEKSSISLKIVVINHKTVERSQVIIANIIVEFAENRDFSVNL